MTGAFSPSLPGFVLILAPLMGVMLTNVNPSEPAPPSPSRKGREAFNYLYDLPGGPDSRLSGSRA